MPSENPQNRGQLTLPEKRALAQDACDKHGYNPFEEMIVMATEKEKIEVNGQIMEVHSSTREQRISIAKEIASYLAPKVKTQDTGAKGPSSFHITINRFGRDEKMAEKSVAIDVSEEEDEE